MNPRHHATLPVLLALALAALASPRIADARCASGVLTAWPPTDAPLALRPTILLEGTGTQQPTIAALGKDGRAALVHGKQRIPLTVEAIHPGARRVTQAVLTPASPLTPGTRYALELRDAAGKRVAVTDYAAERPRPTAWTTAAAATPPPTLTAAPTVVDKTHAQFGCGPAAHVHLAVSATAPAPLAAEVTLREDGAAPITYVVPIEDGALHLGHGMCGGPFDLTGPERQLRAELTLRDAAGHRVHVPTPLTFTGVAPDRRR